MTGFAAFNRTRRVLVAADVEVARTVWKRVRGLMGRAARDFPEGKGFWIVPSEGIHTLGMRFPIDVCYLDRNGQIVRAYHRLRPFRFAAVLWRAHSVLELPAGVLLRTSTEVGDTLEIKPIVT